MLDQSPYYSRDELLQFGFTSVGHNTQVSRKVSIYGVSGTIGDYSRIDDFSILKGRIEIGIRVHIACFVHLGGHKDYPITFDDCSTISSHGSIFSVSADYRAPAISNPLVPLDMQANINGPVHLCEGVVIGSHCVVLPGVEVGIGTSVGANLLIYKSIPSGKVVVSRHGRAEIVGERDADAIRVLAARARALSFAEKQSDM